MGSCQHMEPSVANWLSRRLLLTLLSLVCPFFVCADTGLQVIEQLTVDGGTTVVVSIGKNDIESLEAPQGNDPIDRLQGLGFATYVDPDQDILVLQKHSEHEKMLSSQRPVVAVARLVSLLDLQILEQRTAGFVECSTFEGEARTALIHLLMTLEGWYEFSNADGAKASLPDDLFLGVWSGYELFARYVNENGVIVVRKARRHGWFSGLPPMGMPQEPKPASGSALWWIWPYGESSWGQRIISGLNLGDCTLGELLSHVSKEIGGEFLLGPQARELRDKPLYVIGDATPLSKLLWSIEIITGQVLHVVSTDPFVFVLSCSSAPPTLADPEQFMVITQGAPSESGFWNSEVGRYVLEIAGYKSLPPGVPRNLVAACDPAYVSPSKSTAGALLLRTGPVGDAGLPLCAAWRLEDLPNIYSWAVNWPKESKGAREPQDRMLIWIGGLEVRLERRENERGWGVAFFLPEF